MKKFLPLLFMILSHSLFSRGIVGVYYNQDLGKVIVRSFGEKNNGYFVQIKGVYYFFKAFDKSNVHWLKTGEGTYKKWEISKEQKSLLLQMSSDAYLLKKTKNKIPQLTEVPQLDQEGFFDFNTSNYCAGEFYDLSYKAFLPFQINREFIVKQSLKRVHFEWREGTKKSEETKMRYDFYYAFDTYGNITNMKSTTFDNGQPTENEIEWFYYYRNASEGILDSIHIHTKIPTGENGNLRVHKSALYFDEDNWGIDEKGQKKPRVFQFNWTYENQLPTAWKGTKGKREDYNMSFKYKEQQLTKMTFTNEKHNHNKVNEFIFNYDEKGALSQVIRISDK